MAHHRRKGCHGLKVHAGLVSDVQRRREHRAAASEKVGGDFSIILALVLEGKTPIES